MRSTRHLHSYSPGTTALYDDITTPNISPLSCASAKYHHPFKYRVFLLQCFNWHNGGCTRQSATRLSSVSAIPGAGGDLGPLSSRIRQRLAYLALMSRKNCAEVRNDLTTITVSICQRLVLPI